MRMKTDCDRLRCAVPSLAACLFDVSDVCVLNRPGNIVMTIIASAMLLPTTASLVVAWLDARAENSDEERTRLLYASLASSLSRPLLMTRLVTATAIIL